MTTTVLTHTGLGGTLKLRVRPTPDELYAMRAGTYGQWRGVEVIGYLGIADRLGYRTRDGRIAEQTARRLWATRAGWFPGPAFTIPDGAGHNVQLFDWPAVREAAIQVDGLAPDGTPRRRRGRRGPAKTRTT